MQIIADLHLHSKYARAVSPQMELPVLAKWAAVKGIDLVGTGDWTHPLWINELKSQLEEAGEGVFRLKKEFVDQSTSVPVKETKDAEVRFLLTTEISSIYTQGGKGRRVHNLVFAPSFEVIEEINQDLSTRGCNLSSDGRPIIGLSSKEVAELVFDASEDCLLIPAHIWTPWFSLFGSKSGFDSLEECFGEFSDRIYGVETGLSSDPAMNWRIKELDSRAILSFSDAHSPRNLGREATVFEIEDPEKLTYQEIKTAVIQSEMGKVSKSLPRIAYTIEFFPEEGKYHYTGHRKCDVCHSPEETARLGTNCPVCGQKLTVGVVHQVKSLADREVKTQVAKSRTGVNLVYDQEKKRVPYAMLVPLLEVIAESLRVNKRTKKAEREYFKLVNQLGPEFVILLKTPIEEIGKVSGERIAQAIQKVRDGDLYIKPGFDGVFGAVKIWEELETGTKGKKEQLAIF